MGVNKADVRFIVHLAPPRSLEAYAQESGRAGRDGLPARCVLLTVPADRQNLAQNARRDEVDLATLRRVYAALRRLAAGEWAIVDPAVLLPAPEDDDDTDPRVALGVLEQAGLIRRQPDAPVTYTLRGSATRSDAGAGSPEWQRIAPLLGDEWASRGAATVRTDRLCAESGLSPVELDRVLADAPGVAVREGQRAMCLRLEPVAGDAAATLQALLDRARRQAEERIGQIVAYTGTTRCRHAAIAAHFGERLDDCGTVCDNCTGTARAGRQPAAAAPSASLTATDALAVLDAVRTLPFPVGKAGLTRLLAGSVESRIRADRSASFGALAGQPRGKIEGFIDRLVDDGFIFRDMEHEYRLLRLTDAGRAATVADLSAYDQPPAARPGGLSAIPDDDLDPADQLLLQRLTDWRRGRAMEEAVPPYVIAHNSTLRNIAVARPATRAALLAVPGLGPTRVERYGDELLALVGAAGDGRGGDGEAAPAPFARTR